MTKTTIQVSKDTLERLKMSKSHPLESYDITINLLLDEAEGEVLTEDEIEEIKSAIEEVRRGETIPLDQVAKELGVKLD